ncbi:hypothetical protein MTQ62_22295, partial [Escherichia coli]|nr:hypothetical protein [Escherichia coli]
MSAKHNLQLAQFTPEAFGNGIHASIHPVCVDTVMACKFFPGPVSRIAGMPDTAPSGAVFFI